MSDSPGFPGGTPPGGGWSPPPTSPNPGPPPGWEPAPTTPVHGPGPGFGSSGPPAGPPREPAPGPPGGFGPPGSAPFGPAPQPAGRRRSRTPLVVLAVLVLLGLVGGLVAWGLANRSSAEKWRDRDQAARVEVAKRVDELETTRDELSDTQDRLARLASEKANLADQREVLQQIVQDAPAVTEAMRECNDATTEVAALAISLSASPNPDFNELNDVIDQADSLCQGALSAADDLERTIDSLGL